MGRKTFATSVIDKNRFILFCDNLDGQTFHFFSEKIRELPGTVIDRSPGKTGACQPVDGGFGRLLKALSKANQQEWLGYEGNIDK